MIEELRQRLRGLEKPPGLEDGPAALPLGASAVDRVLGGGLMRGALHEFAALGEAHAAAATGFVTGVAARAAASLVWVAEDMAALESGALHGPGLDGFGVAPERLTTVAVGQRRDLLWAMEEALRCRAVGCVVGEMRHGALDAVAVRRLSLAAAETGALALVLRAAPEDDASTAATRWMVGAAASAHAQPCFAVALTRNRRGPRGQWILEWSDSDGRFTLAAHAQPVAALPVHRPHRQIARSVA